MTIPSAAAKTHLDSGTDDPKQARGELADLVDKFNTLRSHLTTSGLTSGTSVLGIGTGLQSLSGNLRVNVGSGVGQIVQLEDVGGTPGLPAVDGSQLTGLLGGLLQLAIDKDGVANAGTPAIPIDDTIPQITEGTEFQTVTVTPQSATSTLLIVHVGLYSTSIGGNLQVALFKDSDANALAATTINATGSGQSVPLIHFEASGNTNARTYRIRAGLDSAIQIFFNRTSTTQVFSTIPKSVLLVLEIA